MGDSLIYGAWFERARMDLRGAKILMEHDGGYELVSFHCQQAIEKQLKGWILRQNGELLDGHHLSYLSRYAARLGAPLLQADIRDCSFAGQFYVETRYPADNYDPVTKEDALNCLDIAETILEKLK